MKNDNEQLWRTKDGRKIAVKDMHLTHIENTLKMLKRKGFIDPETYNFYINCTPPTADGALMAFEQELDIVLSSPVSPFIGIFEREIERRKNSEE